MVQSSLGIGIAPLYDLHISKASDAIFQIDADSDNSGENDNPLIRLTQDGGSYANVFGINGDADAMFTGALDNAGYIGSQGNVDFQIITNNSPRINILKTGEIGIGTATPTSALQLGSNAGTAASGIKFGATGDTNLYRSAADILKTDDTFDALAYRVGGTAGASTTCSGGQFLQNQVVSGGITTGGTCAAAGGGGDAYLANNQTFTGRNIFTGSGNGSTTYGVLFKNVTNSTTALQVQNLAGATLLGVDTSNTYVNISGGAGLQMDNAVNIRFKDSAGTYRNTITYSSANNLQFTNRGTSGNLQLQNHNDTGRIAFSTGSAVTEVASISATGEATFQNSTNSTAGFLVKNSGGTNIIRVDTTNSKVGLGTSAPDPQTQLHIYGDGLNGSEARIALGDYNGGVSENVFVGEYGTGDTDVLQLQGKLGINFTTEPTATEIPLSLSSSGQATFQNNSNSTTAFEVKDTFNVSVLTVNTNAQQVNVTNLYNSGYADFDGYLTVDGDTTIGDAATDTLTVNSESVFANTVNVSFTPQTIATTAATLTLTPTSSYVLLQCNRAAAANTAVTLSETGARNGQMLIVVIDGVTGTAGTCSWADTAGVQQIGTTTAFDNFDSKTFIYDSTNATTQWVQMAESNN